MYASVRRALIHTTLLLVPSLAFAQGSILQNGSVARDDVTKFFDNKIAGAAGGLTGDARGHGVNPYSITDNTGLGLCSNTALTSGNYQAMCIGHDSSGNGLISVNPGGASAALGLKVNINGSVYDFPGAGSGNVIGPSPTVVGNLVAWNSTGGTSVSDTGLGQVQNPIPVPAALTTAGLPALIGFNSPGGIAFRKTTATATDGNNVLIVRDAVFTGGVFGNINTALNTTCHAGSGILSFEWCGLFYMDNNAVLADNNENAGLYIKSAKRTTGKTWGLTVELDDYNQVTTATGQSITLELDHYSNGPDLGAARGILHLVANKLIGGDPTPNVTFGIKIGESTVGGTFTDGIFFGATTFAVGIDMRQGSYSSAPIWLRDDAPISWSTNGIAKTFYDLGTNTVQTTYPMSIAGTAGTAALTVIDGTGTVSTGLDLRGADFSSAAIWMRDDKPLAWSTDGTKKTVWDTASSTIKTTGAASFTSFLTSANLTMTAAASVVAAAQVGFGSTTAAAANCNSTAAIAPVACLVINVAGTTRYVPYF